MCEFTVKTRKNSSEVGEDIVILHYTDDEELLLKDIIGSGGKLDSALIYEVNTIDQFCTIIEDPLIKPFLKLIKDLQDTNATSNQIDQLINQLSAIKAKL